MIDENGYPGCRDNMTGEFDGGDTAAILGTLWFFGEFLDFPLHAMREAPLRHYDTTKWYGQPDRFSRDQLLAVLAGLVPRGRSFQAQMILAMHRKRYFLTAWNTRKNGAMDAPEKFPDITGPEVWALWLRIFKPWWARLVLPILDLETLGSSIHWRLGRKDRVTRNHMLVLLAARKSLPTITTRLADWITDWPDLIQRWTDHCFAVGEYQTGYLFKVELDKANRI